MRTREGSVFIPSLKAGGLLTPPSPFPRGKSYRYRIYPTKSQRSVLDLNFELCRHVYNDTLALRKDAWEKEHGSISLYDTNSILVSWKAQRPELKRVYSQVLQNVQVRVDLAFEAFKAFFRRVKAGEGPGYPRFKGKGQYDSITYKQLGFGIKDGKLHLAKIGDIKRRFGIFGQHLAIRIESRNESSTGGAT